MNGTHSGPINIGNPGEFTILELANMVKNKINPELEITFSPLPQDDPLQRKPVIDLAIKELNWKPYIELNEGLQDTIEYFKEIIT
jgi:UDP-glucuronate decarboxylase